MSLYIVLLTVENNKNKKSLKFQGDTLNLNDLFRFLYLPHITTLRSYIVKFENPFYYFKISIKYDNRK